MTEENYVVHGGETWSLTLKEEHRLNVFKDRELRISRPKMDELVAGWRKLQL
jgi:hypothetical protein